MRRSRIVDCRAGLHRPHGSIDRNDDGVQRGNCRGCGCALIRTSATRIWYLSGLIG